MIKRNKLTTNQSEDEIAALMSHDAVFVIPFFQRPYKWRSERVKRFHADLVDLVENANDFHFLGAIITHERKSDPAEPRQIEVIDGQQRITTIFLYFCAIVRELCAAMRYDEAKRLFFDHLVAQRKAAASNIRLHSCLEDRAQLNWVFETLLSDDGFVASLGKFSLQELQTNGSTIKGQLKKNFQQICCFLQTERNRGGVARVREIYAALAKRVTVVRLELFNPLNGPKIFDSLNSRQEPMTIGELVRNEIFSRVGDEDPAALASVDKSHWQPFYRKFHHSKRNLFDEYFFPYGLIQDPNLKKSGVYTALRDSWAQDKSPEQVIKKLSLYQDPFLDIRTGSNLSRHDERLSLAFRRLYELGAPSSVLPFFMRLSVAVSERKVGLLSAVRIAEVIESFLVRRAVCGFEPTGLHAVFKRLWLDCGASPTATRVADEIAKHKTVPWPANDEFKTAILTRPLYGAAVTKFLIAQYDKDLGGDAPSDIPFIEHILPQTLTPEWRRLFSDTAHAEMKDLLGNLLPLSGPMNASLGNRSFAQKRRSYLEDSMFKSSRQFARGVEKWAPKELNARGEALADWALRRWPHAR